MELKRQTPFQFGLVSLFGITLVVALPVGAWRFGGLLQAIAWLPVEMLLGILGVELAAWTIPKIIELRQDQR
jgi:hypothetical protein